MSGTEKWNRVPALFGRVSGTRFLCPAYSSKLNNPKERKTLTFCNVSNILGSQKNHFNFWITVAVGFVRLHMYRNSISPLHSVCFVHESLCLNPFLNFIPSKCYLCNVLYIFICITDFLQANKINVLLTHTSFF